MDGVYATNGFVSNINGASTDKFLFICNRFENDSYNAIISPDIEKKYSVNEYVGNIITNNGMKCENLSENSGIKKVTFLVL